MISCGMMVGEPAMLAYGGLSGLATGMATLLGLVMLSERDGADRTVGALGLALVGLKLGQEVHHVAPMLSEFGDASIQVATWAHGMGAGMAMVFFGGQAGGKWMAVERKRDLRQRGDGSAIKPGLN
ncbi:MAG: hypothetical protein J6386_09110 [Candidatus Synoicihabitans palmerolidicus]|nr:hypothetical protein [Candidatus Synoicihabitans palmerolidicus]